jgi:CheY-like chemotaxis protein
MKKILVVEDDYILALVQVKFLQKMGFNIVGSVTNGPDAIEVARNTPPDVIIMDVRIEGDMDGIDTMFEIQKFSEVPVIYLTGNSEGATIERAKQTNMKGFFVKPINFNDLEGLIRSF